MSVAGENGMRVTSVGVVRITTKSPSDVSGLLGFIEARKIEPRSILAILGKTEGNGGVNDFTREYAVSAYSRVKSFTPPFPSVFPSIARIDLGSILRASIKPSRPETSLGLLVVMRTTPTDVTRIPFSPATDMKRYSVHPTAQRIPPPAMPIAAKICR